MGQPSLSNSQDGESRHRSTCAAHQHLPYIIFTHENQFHCELAPSQMQTEYKKYAWHTEWASRNCKTPKAASHVTAQHALHINT